MGKGGGTVEGRTKLATWIKLQREMEQMGVSRNKADDEALHLDYPTSKVQAFEMMERKPDGSGWTLSYHFSA